MEKRALVKREIAKYLLYVALFLLLFVTFNLLIATVLFIFRISVQPWYVIMAGVLSILAVAFMMKKRQFLNWKSVAIVIVVPLLTITGLTVLNGKIYDSTYDGNNYHKLAIGLMMEGWNPLYETEAEFVENGGSQIELGGETFHWGDYYAKASHIFAANIGSLTGNVESGKVLNEISILATCAVLIAVCLYAQRTWVFSLLFSAIAVSLPTISGQFLTNYVDLLVYLYIFLLVALIFSFEYMKNYRIELFAVFFMTLVILINIKFSSFAYAGILCAGYYVWYIYRCYRGEPESKNFLKRFTFVALGAFIVGVFVVGLSVYPRNMVFKGNPFYPLLGEGKEDIMTKNSPDYFKEKNNVERFAIATFSKMDNISEASGREAEYKIPFSIDENELEFLGHSDLRISGNGPFFSGILIVAFIVVIIGAKKLFMEDKKLFVLIMIPIGITFGLMLVMSDVWWARYFPQIHFVVFAALIILSRYKSVIAKVVLYSFMSLLLVNNFMYFNAAVRISYDFTTSVKEGISFYKSLYSAEECIVSLETDKFPGSYYDGRYAFSEYDIVYKKWIPEENDEYIALMNPFLIGKCEKK